jgi:hypothetical protein
MQTMKAFVRKNKITIDSVMVGENPNFDADPKWQGYHYKVTLKYKKKQMTIYFSMGIGLDHEPKAEEVLDCLSSDSSSVENNNFEDWCRDLGYDTNSRKAEKIYKICQKQAEKLEKFLGKELYKELLWNTELD